MTHAEFLAAKAALYEEYKNSTSESAGGGIVSINCISWKEIEEFIKPTCPIIYDQWGGDTGRRSWSSKWNTLWTTGDSIHHAYDGNITVYPIVIKPDNYPTVTFYQDNSTQYVKNSVYPLNVMDKTRQYGRQDYANDYPNLFRPCFRIVDRR